uniref:Mechanosensitive ion channel family protein n=1 Tax=Chryseobacterium endophyticum TaxID=1854762 RepID=A0AAU6WPU0_9FLAO
MIASEILQELTDIDRPEAAEVIFTDLKQGIFTLQVKFWMAVGANMGILKSKAFLKIKEKLDHSGIQLVTPTSISITAGDPNNLTGNSDK